MKQFTPSPATVTVETEEGNVVWVGERVEYGPAPANNTPNMVIIHIRDDEKHIGLGDISHESRTLVLSETVNGGKVTIRPAVEGDVPAAVSIDQDIPLPMSVISTMVASPGNRRYPMESTLHALTDERGFVASMLLMAEEGLFLRYDSAWHAVKEPDLVADLEVLDAEPDALQIYDQYDSVGQSLHAGSLPLKEGEIPAPPLEPIAEPDEPTSDTLSASRVQPDAYVAPPVLSTIQTTEDLRGAITAAGASPTELQRWYITKRARALDREDLIPW